MNERTTKMRPDTEKAPISAARIATAALLMALCLGFIWANSLMSSYDSSRISEAVSAFLGNILGGVFGGKSWIVLYVHSHVRKIAHAVEFFALGAMSTMMLIVLRRVNLHMLLHAVLFVLAVAVSDEFIQLFTGRGSAVQDVVLDFCGALSGIVLLVVARWFFRSPAKHRTS